MKVTKVGPIVLQAPVKEPWRIGTAVYTSMHAVLVRVETDEGITGFGEGLARFSTRAAASVVEDILGPVVVGQDPFNVELIWDRMYAVMRGRGHSKGYVLEGISAVDIIQPDIGRAGGFTECRRIAALASAFDVPVAPHTGASAAVEVAAATQWSAALSNFLIFEYMYPHNPLREELLLDPLPTAHAGHVEVPQNPGLGVEVDEKALAKFRIR